MLLLRHFLLAFSILGFFAYSWFDLTVGAVGLVLSFGVAGFSYLRVASGYFCGKTKVWYNTAKCKTYLWYHSSTARLGNLDISGTAKSVCTHVSNNRWRYSIAGILAVAGIAFILFRKRIKNTVRRYLRKWRNEPELVATEEALHGQQADLLGESLSAITGLALLTGSVGVVLGKGNMRALFQTLRDVHVIKTAAMCGVALSKYLVYAVEFCLETTGLGSFCPGFMKTVKKFSKGTGAVDEYIDVGALLETEKYQKMFQRRMAHYKLKNKSQTVPKDEVQSIIKELKDKESKARANFIANGGKSKKHKKGKEKEDEAGPPISSEELKTALTDEDGWFVEISKKKWIRLLALVLAMIILGFIGYYLYVYKWSDEKLKDRNPIKAIIQPEALAKVETVVVSTTPVVVGSGPVTQIEVTTNSAEVPLAAIPALKEAVKESSVSNSVHTEKEKFDVVETQIRELKASQESLTSMISTIQSFFASEEKRRGKMAPEEYDEKKQREQEEFDEIARHEAEERRLMRIEHDRDELERERDRIEEERAARKAMRLSERTWGAMMDRDDEIRAGRRGQRSARGEARGQPSFTKVKETDPPKKEKDTASKERGTKHATKKEGKLNFNRPCTSKTCDGKEYSKVIQRPGKAPVTLKTKCQFQHPPKPESRVPSSIVMPANIHRWKHAVVQVRTGAGEWIANANGVCASGAFLSAKHGLGSSSNPTVKVLRMIEKPREETEKVVSELTFNSKYADLDLVAGPKPATMDSYKPAVPVIDEPIWVVGWDIANPKEPRWHVSDGVVQEVTPEYAHLKGHLCHTATTHPGLSGAAVINQRGQIVGITTYGADRSTAPANAFLAFSPQLCEDFSSSGWSKAH